MTKFIHFVLGNSTQHPHVFTTLFFDDFSVSTIHEFGIHDTYDSHIMNILTNIMKLTYVRREASRIFVAKQEINEANYERTG